MTVLLVRKVMKTSGSLGLFLLTSVSKLNLGRHDPSIKKNIQTELYCMKLMKPCVTTFIFLPSFIEFTHSIFVRRQ